VPHQEVAEHHGRLHEGEVGAGVEARDRSRGLWILWTSMVGWVLQRTIETIRMGYSLACKAASMLVLILLDSPLYYATVHLMDVLLYTDHSIIAVSRPRAPSRDKNTRYIHRLRV